MITTSRVAPDVVALSSAIPGPGGMCLPVNAYVVLGREPTLVDTGLSPVGEEFRTALWNLVEPADLARVVVTHDDRDHTGSLREILDAAPRARVVTNFVSMVKIGEDWQLPFDRLDLVNSGDRVPIGDDELVAFRPPHYDSPGTLAFHALGRGVCFGSDCLGAFLPGDVDLGGTADDLPAQAYDGGRRCSSRPSARGCTISRPTGGRRRWPTCAGAGSGPTSARTVSRSGAGSTGCSTRPRGCRPGRRSCPRRRSTST